MKLNCQEINQAKRRMELARIRLKNIVKFVQTECEHHVVMECSFSPPIRVCMHCGITEEGWGCGYSILAKGINNVPEISGDDFNAVRIGFFIRQDAEPRIFTRERLCSAIAAK